MSFSIIVPNAGQSPGLFPAQNNDNFTRLKAIINAEHNFTDSSSTSQGLHKQVTLINRSDPTAPLAAGDGIVFSKIVDGVTQLFFFNGTDIFQITPGEDLYPIRVTGSQSLATNTSFTIYPDPGFEWAGTGWAILSGDNQFSFYNLLRSGSNDTHVIDENSTGTNVPTLSFSTNDLRIRNNSTITKTVIWSLIINRIS